MTPATLEELDTLVACTIDDPAATYRDTAPIDLDADVQITVHGEPMSFLRAVLELMSMIRRRDDPRAIELLEEQLRQGVEAALRNDPDMRRRAQAAADAWETA